MVIRYLSCLAVKDQRVMITIFPCTANETNVHSNFIYLQIGQTVISHDIGSTLVSRFLVDIKRPIPPALL